VRSFTSTHIRFSFIKGGPGLSMFAHL
jgi:hypothetical protein